MATTISRRVSIYLDGKEAAGGIRALTKERAKLKRAIEDGTLSEQQYIAAFKRLDEINPIIDKHKKNLYGIESGWSKLKSGVGKFAAVAGIAFGADLVIDYGKKLFGVGVEMDTLGRKATTVLGPSLGKVTAEAEKNAAAMGLTNSQYTAAVTNIADMLKPMGFTTEEAAAQSVQMQNLAGALSEWSGGQFSAQEVSASFRKALVGEREELERYGISIKQSEINTRLAEQGLEKLTGQAKQQAEAMATLQLITEKSTDAQISYAENSDSLVRRQAELSAKITTISEKLATLLIPVFDRLVDVASAVVDGLADVTDFVSGLIEPAGRLTDEFDEQSNKVQQLEKELPGLLDRYEELTGKTNLTQVEQAELAEVIKRIGDLTPGAITQVDEYGNALAINAGKSREFLEAEKARLAFVNKEAIEALEKQIEATKRLAATQKQYIEEGGGRKLVEGIKETGAQLTFVRATADQIERARKELGGLTTELKGAESELKRLRGEPLADAPTSSTGTPGETPEERAAKAAKAEAAKKEAERRAEERQKEADREVADLEKRSERLLQLLAKYQEEERLSTLNAEDRKIAELESKYDEQIKEALALEANGVTDATAQRLELERLKAQAVGALRSQLLRENFDAEQAQVAAQQEEANIAELERTQAKQEAERTIAEQLRQAIFDERQQAIFELETHYQQLLALASQYGLDTLDLEIAFRREKEKIDKDFDRKTLDETVKVQVAKLQALQANYQAFGELALSLGDLFGEEGKKSAAFQKALTLTQIALDTASAISSLTAASEANPANAFTFGAAGVAQFVTGLARIIANIAQAKRVLGEATVPQRKTGGWVNVTGADDGITYRAKYIGEPQTGMLDYDHPVLYDSASGQQVLANERGREFLISDRSLRNPVVANYARLVDNIQRGRTGQFQEGGFTALAPAAATAAPPSLSTGGADNGTNAALLAAVTRLNSILESGIVALIDDDGVVNIFKQMKKIDKISGGGLV